MSACNSCRAPIIWTTNVKTGNRMPVDSDPVAGGNIVLTSGNDGPESRVLTKAELASHTGVPGGGTPLHISHFATCPHAAGHRR